MAFRWIQHHFNQSHKVRAQPMDSIDVCMFVCLERMAVAGIAVQANDEAFQI